MTDTEYANELLHRVRDLIDSAGLTVEEFAETADHINAERFLKSLTGEKPFSSFDLAVIAEHFGTTVDYLITGVKRHLRIIACTLDESHD